LFRQELVERRDYQALERHAAELVQWVRAARGPVAAPA